MTTTKKKLTGYVTLCNSCAATLNAKQHGAPDANHCQSCDKVFHSTSLATYRIKKAR